MSRINLKELIEELEEGLRFLSLDIEGKYIAISKKKLGNIITKLKELENIYNQ